MKKKFKEKYNAFISYHHDITSSSLARQILNRLEKYKILEELGISAKQKLYLCRDTVCFSAGEFLDEQMKEAIDRSDWFIYLASKKALKSLYCAKEIDYFKQKNGGKLDHIIIIVVDGTPKKVIPKKLLYEGFWDDEPLETNYREPHFIDLRFRTGGTNRWKFNRSITMMAAPLLNCDLDVLARRDKKRHKIKIAGICMLFFLAAIAVGIYCNFSADYYLQKADTYNSNYDKRQALFYYAKSLSYNPFSKKANLNAKLLLQNANWSLMTDKQEDSRIIGKQVFLNHDNGLIFTDQFSEYKTSCHRLLTTTDSKYTLWQSDDDHSTYFSADTNGNIIRMFDYTTMHTTTNYSESIVADVWKFVSTEEEYVSFYWPKEDRLENLDVNTLLEDQTYIDTVGLSTGEVMIVFNKYITINTIADGNLTEKIRFSVLDLIDDSLQGNEATIYDVFLSPNCTTAAVASTAIDQENRLWGNVSIIDAISYQKIQEKFRQDYYAEDIIIDSDREQFAVVYENDYSSSETQYFTTLYDFTGNNILETETAYSLNAPRGFFAGDLYLECKDNINFWNINTGKVIAEPLPAYTNHAALLDNNRLVFEHSSDVYYIDFLQFSGYTEEENSTALEKKLGDTSEAGIVMVSENLFCTASDDCQIIYLLDAEGNKLDSFECEDPDMEFCELTFGKTSNNLFALDSDENGTTQNLYMIPIDFEEKCFLKESVNIQTDIMFYTPAKEGIIFVNNDYTYLRSNPTLWYYIKDEILWIKNPKICAYGNSVTLKGEGELQWIFSSEADYFIPLYKQDTTYHLYFYPLNESEYSACLNLRVLQEIYVEISSQNILYTCEDNEGHELWFGNKNANYTTIRQLEKISGYAINGNSMFNEQGLSASYAMNSEINLGSWKTNIQSKNVGLFDLSSITDFR